MSQKTNSEAKHTPSAAAAGLLEACKEVMEWEDVRPLDSSTWDSYVRPKLKAAIFKAEQP